MQQSQPQPDVQTQVEYASLGMRFAAVVIDTVIVYVLVSMIWGVVLAMRNPLDPQDPAAVQALIQELQASMGTFYAIFLSGFFLYYLLFEAIFSASLGKLLLSMRVVMVDGTRVTGLAVVARNLVRVPEALLLYIPAGVSCLAGPRCQRLGDHAARTVVVRRRTQRPTAYGRPGGWPQAGPPAPPVASVPPAPAPPWPAAPGDSPVAASAQQPSAEEALGRLKTAALAARGAHLTYLRFSERELAADVDTQAGGYSDGYVSAWFTLTDAVAALRAARAEFVAATGGADADGLIAAQPDLAHLVDQLEPYLTATDDDAVHAAFLTVARAEASTT